MPNESDLIKTKSSNNARSMLTAVAMMIVFSGCARVVWRAPRPVEIELPKATEWEQWFEYTRITTGGSVSRWYVKKTEKVASVQDASFFILIKVIARDRSRDAREDMKKTAEHEEKECKRSVATPIHDDQYDATWEFKHQDCSGKNDNDYIDRIVYIENETFVVEFQPRRGHPELSPSEREEALRLISSVRFNAPDSSGSTN